MQSPATAPTALKEKLLTMASHAEASVRQAIEALATRDYDLAARVQASEEIIDQCEIEIDELAIGLLGQAPPPADLRLITVAMKISQNLERVGDEATTIARRVRELCQEPPLNLRVDIPEAATLAIRMLKAALDAFVHQDPAAARDLIPQDKQVDALNKHVHETLTRHMIADPDTIPRALNLMVISKSLERVADHAKNIAEEVVYLCEALDIRHAGTRT
jgi:phosphate transport system protein